MATVRDVLHYYSNARSAYERFISHGSHPEVARNAVALLLWLDQSNQHVMRHVPTLIPDAVGHLVNDIKSIIDRLPQLNLMLPSTPLLSALCHDGGIDPAVFAFSQDIIVHGLVQILDGVGALIFDDRLYRLFRRHQTGLLGRSPEIEAPYVSTPVTMPEDCRSMFITFSRGQAVERDEIFDYFRHKWGDCIVRVLLEKTTGGALPMYGRIIFKSEAFVSLALNGKDKVPIFIRDREIWLRKYIPRPHNVV